MASNTVAGHISIILSVHTRIRQIRCVHAAALRHRVVVVDGLKEFTHELKGIGRDFNQLVVLSNMGKIKEVHLDETWQALAKNYLGLQELAEREVR